MLVWVHRDIGISVHSVLPVTILVLSVLHTHSHTHMGPYGTKSTHTSFMPDQAFLIWHTSIHTHPFFPLLSLSLSHKPDHTAQDWRTHSECPTTPTSSDTHTHTTLSLSLTHTNTHTHTQVGPHGAGLTHTLFMPDRAYLIEIFIDGSTGLEHFNNMHSLVSFSVYIHAHIDTHTHTHSLCLSLCLSLITCILGSLFPYIYTHT